MQAEVVVDLAVQAAEAALRVERLQLRVAKLAVDAARTQVRLAERRRDDAVGRSEQRDGCGSGDASPSSPAAKKRKAWPSPGAEVEVEARERLAALQAQEAVLEAEAEAATGRVLELQRHLDLHELPAASSQSAPHCMEMEMAALPEDELLQVLSYLSPGELLQCRQVCRRWRDLALHPDLWRSKSLDADSASLVAAALRLAPCLDHLYMCGSESMALLGVLLSSTRCAVSQLYIRVHPADAVLAAVVISRQAALGRLRCVRLSLVSDDLNEETAFLRLQRLQESLLYTPGLELLELSFDEGTANIMKTRAPVIHSTSSDLPVPASLQVLEYMLEFTDTYLPLHLEWHASTLEDVTFWSTPPPPRTAALLSTMANLRELCCPMMADMPAILQCTELKVLRLTARLDDATRPFLPGVLKFLREAVMHLEDLTLDFSVVPHLQATDTVLRLGGSGDAVPALKSLQFQFLCEKGVSPSPPGYETVPLRNLATIIHRLKNLVLLDLDGPLLDDLLHELDGEVLPHLQELHFNLPEPCMHKWANREQVRAAVLRCPLLHLSAMSKSEEGACSFCQGCCRHDSHVRHFVFSHPTEAICGVTHFDSDIHIK
ncbi:uncharacterized protein LOC117647166 isoform X1 [Thrips palmi]|uniref:Uncharacterized protein LOC117647166 isoform X1 n=1 Tax=Thrips palmi TaxID=161013 RepID=A0A6P8ZB14_THRPL|nr:uncharacterized protein LOC117647166 isoform X1 [Thrips palmi]XP_034244632.1 uncharacterized protein LOC117647166 isoform X1 [Thrips palmi]